MIVDFTAPAHADLVDILTYIAQDNAVAALEVVDEIERFCTVTLADNPKIGTNFPTSVGDIRMFPKNSYNIFYQIGSDRIAIIRVLHHSRLAADILAGR